MSDCICNNKILIFADLFTNTILIQILRFLLSSLNLPVIGFNPCSSLFVSCRTFLMNGLALIVSERSEFFGKVKLMPPFIFYFSTFLGGLFQKLENLITSHFMTKVNKLCLLITTHLSYKCNTEAKWINSETESQAVIVHAYNPSTWESVLG